MAELTPENILEFLGKTIREVAELRGMVVLPEVGSAPGEYLKRLQATRIALDRIEELMRKLGLVKAQVKNQAAQANDIADDAWDTAAQKAGPVVDRRSDFTGPRERYAHFALATMSEKRQARKMRDLLEDVSGAYEYVRAAHRGLDGVRADILAILRAVQFESSLERST